MNNIKNLVLFTFFLVYVSFFSAKIYASEYVVKITKESYENRIVIGNSWVNFDLSCEENSIDNLDGTCTTRQETGTILDCPSGYSYLNGQCYKYNTYSATYGCQFKVLINNVCYVSWGRTKHPDGTYTCPSHTTAYGSKCIDYSGPTIPKFYYCSSSYSLSGRNCYATLYTTGTVTCPENYLLNNSICEKEVILNATKICPIGYNLNETQTKCEK